MRSAYAGAGNLSWTISHQGGVGIGAPDRAGPDSLAADPSPAGALPAQPEPPRVGAT